MLKEKWEKLKILALRKWLIHCEELQANCVTFHHTLREQCIDEGKMLKSDSLNKSFKGKDIQHACNVEKQ